MESKQALFDAIVVVTGNDFMRMKSHHRRMVELLPARRLIFCGNAEVEDFFYKEKEEGIFDGIEDKVDVLSEDDVLAIADVKQLWDELKNAYLGKERNIGTSVGWYYQQFLKYAYAYICKDDYYLAWDGDTVPCKKISLFSEQGIPYFDYKRENHEEYFITMERLLHLKKVISPSFISEHMLFRCDLVKELIGAIERNDSIEGDCWWKKILYSIRKEKLFDNSFSEFETYGTYNAIHHPMAYRLREWHSFRYAGFFFDINDVQEKDWSWLSRDFMAVSFERNHGLRPDTKNLFNNPRYQEKLSARQMLELMQKEFFDEDDLREIWDN
ncbi:MAG: hypothetical protein J6N53_06235 [Lachnospiraceae bacterium]|nr:hypothetical protein [Lachnospiraceae bacterium]